MDNHSGGVNGMGVSTSQEHGELSRPNLTANNGKLFLSISLWRLSARFQEHTYISDQTTCINYRWCQVTTSRRRLTINDIISSETVQKRLMVGNY